WHTLLPPLSMALPTFRRGTPRGELLGLNVWRSRMGKLQLAEIGRGRSHT
ncbi:hypothetical protein COCMIDRAFT_95402, partial [Bipolaris oryzae ATCC 44560]